MQGVFEKAQSQFLKSFSSVLKMFFLCGLCCGLPCWQTEVCLSTSTRVGNDAGGNGRSPTVCRAHQGHHLSVLLNFLEMFLMIYPPAFPIFPFPFFVLIDCFRAATLQFELSCTHKLQLVEPPL